MRSAHRRRGAVLGVEWLEDRTLLATFAGSSGTLTLTLDANDAVSIVANASTYTLNLANAVSTPAWSGSATDVSLSNSNTTLTVTNESTYQNVVITDNTGANAGTSVTFSDSGTNSYASNFDINLTNSAAGPITFNGATSFTGSNAQTGPYGLSASTTASIQVGQSAPQTATVSTVSGDVTLTGAGITFANGSVSSITGNVSLTGTDGSITEAAANGAADVSGATVTLTTTGSGNQIGTAPPVGGSGTPLKVDATSLLNASTSDGFITLANTTGNMPLGVLNAGAALIELTAVGAIIDGTNGTGSSPNLTATDGAALTTTGFNSAIGTATNPIRTALGALTATTYDGGVSISDSNNSGLIINSILAQQGGHPPVLNGSNQVVVNGNPGTDNVSVTATGTIMLASASSSSSTSVNVAAPNEVTITSTGGSIMQGQAGSDNVLAQSVTLTANGSIGVAGGAIGLTVQSFSASTTSGDIFLSELIPGTEVSVTAGGTGSNASVTGTGVTLGIGTITAPGSVTILETGGALVSGTSMNVTGQNVNLTGKSGIGSSGTPFTVWPVPIVLQHSP